MSVYILTQYLSTQIGINNGYLHPVVFSSIFAIPNLLILQLNTTYSIKKWSMEKSHDRMVIPKLFPICTHRLSAPVTYGIHLKVHELPSSESNDDLALVDGALDDRLVARGLPLVHSLVRPDVTDSIRIDLRHNHSTDISFKNMYIKKN